MNMMAGACIKKRQRYHIKEVDSLRALAVLLIIGVYSVPSYLPGGLIGLDIFFVISGFVITRAYSYIFISRNYTLKHFYVDRVSRLAPAVGLILVLTSVACVLMAQPDHLIAFAWSLLAQPLYLQNFVFWIEGDYVSGALSKPLLHTWSLAVGAQFYIVWGGVILFLQRYPGILIWVVIVGAISSLGSGFLVEPNSPPTAFYHLPTRVWEFALGILAYLLFLRSGKWFVRGWWVAVPAVLALAMIMFSAVSHTGGAAINVKQSLMACSATAFILAFTSALPGHPALFWMRLSPVLYVGRISYGLYLWHWPPLAIYYLAYGEAASPVIALGLMLLAFVGAVASYHLVEQPIRHKKWLPSSGSILRAVGGSSVVAAGFALAILWSDGMIQRYPKDIQPLLAAPTERGAFRCGQVFALLNPRAESCPLSETDMSKAGAVLVLGDSHADVLKEMIAESGRVNGRNVHLASRNCDLGRFGSLPFCNPNVFERLIAHARGLGVTDVVAISYWEADKFDASSLIADIRKLIDAGFTVRIMRVVPHHENYDPRLRAKAALAGQPLDLSGVSLATHLADTALVNQTIDQAVAGFPVESVSVLSPADYLCPGDQCLYHRDGTPLYLDSNHLTFTGARELRPMFDALLQR